MPSTPRRRCPGWVFSATPRWSTRSAWPSGAVSASWRCSTTTHGAPTRRSTGWYPNAAGLAFPSSPRSTGWCWTCPDAGSAAAAWNGRLGRILGCPGRPQVGGELVRPARRDDVALRSKSRRRLRHRLEGIVDTAAEPAHLGEIHEPVALPVQPVRSADQFDRLGDDYVGLLMLTVPGEQFRPYAPPQELRSH